MSPSAIRYLTKSRFKLAVECPTKLFYTGKDKVYRNASADDEFLKALAEGGFRALERYCELDTLAMAIVYEAWPRGVQFAYVDGRTYELERRRLAIRRRPVRMECHSSQLKAAK